MPIQKIAIVNNDPGLLALFEDILFDEGYASISYVPTDETYTQLQLTQPSMIMLDLSRHTSWLGWLLLKRLQSNPFTAHIPILICSVDHALIESKQAYFTDKGCAILELPATFTEIIQAINAVIHPDHTPCLTA